MSEPDRAPLYPPPENPFPGMDPWMQRHWPTFHMRFIAEAQERLNPQLPADLRADGEARTFVSQGATRVRRTGPDGAVIERRPGGETDGRPAVLDRTAVAEPRLVPLPAVEERQRYLQIVDLDGERVVTVIEFLSPSNKRRGTPWRAYRRKQRECLAAGVNLVEVDLTRGGRRPMVGPPPDADAVTYAANIWRAEEPDRTEFYPLELREPLPSLLVPLRPGDDDVVLELQPMVDAAYVKGVAFKTDHARPLDPPLPPADAAWAEDVLAGRGAPADR